MATIIRNLTVLVSCMACGCGGNSSEKATDQTKPAAAVSEKELPNVDDPIDYSKWKPLTDKPKRIPLSDFTLCLPSPSDVERRSKLDLHYVPMVKLFVNPIGADKIEQRRESPLPVGAIIVKEKWLGYHPDNKFDLELDESGPGEYAAMIKRDAGYDPDHGDWEYVFVTRRPLSTVQRGQLSKCRDCHAKARDTDYVFLPDPGSDLYY